MSLYIVPVREALLQMADANGSFMGVAESLVFLGKVVRGE